MTNCISCGVYVDEEGANFCSDACASREGVYSSKQQVRNVKIECVDGGKLIVDGAVRMRRMRERRSRGQIMAVRFWVSADQIEALIREGFLSRSLASDPIAVTAAIHELMKILTAAAPGQRAA